MHKSEEPSTESGAAKAEQRRFLSPLVFLSSMESVCSSVQEEAFAAMSDSCGEDSTGGRAVGERKPTTAQSLANQIPRPGATLVPRYASSSTLHRGEAGLKGAKQVVFMSLRARPGERQRVGRVGGRSTTGKRRWARRITSDGS